MEKKRDRTAYNAIWYQEHRVERIAYIREWKLLHPTNVKETLKKHNRTQKRMENERRRNSSERVKALERERYKTPNGRAAATVKDHKHRALKIGATATLATDEWQEIMRDYDNRCVYCNIKPTRLTQDHIIPLTRGGGHIKENVVPACQSCNSSKGNKPLLVWMYRKRGAYDNW